MVVIYDGARINWRIQNVAPLLEIRAFHQRDRATRGRIPLVLASCVVELGGSCRTACGRASVDHRFPLPGLRNYRSNCIPRRGLSGCGVWFRGDRVSTNRVHCA